MKRLASVVVALAVVLACQPLPLTALAQDAGEIAGTAVVEGKPLPHMTLRLRNVDSGDLAGSTTTNEKGEFRFTGLPVGNYVVETVAPNGVLLGTSVRIGLVAGAMAATGVSVSTSAAAAAAAGLSGAATAGAAGAAGAGAAGAAGAGAAAGGIGSAAVGAAAGGAFFATTAGIVSIAAVAAGVTAVVAVAANASPSG